MFLITMRVRVVGGAELFTGNTLLVIAWAAGEIRLLEMLRVWLIVYVGNLIGAVGTGVLAFLSGQYLAGQGTVAEVVLKLAHDKVTLPFDRALFLGILCNVLVCLAIWLSYGARTISDKVLAVIFPVSAFVAAGIEHSVANMYLVPIGLFLKTWGPGALLTNAGVSAANLDALTWQAFFLSLIPATIGNIIGGGVLVGAVYWFIYLRPGRRQT